MLTLLRGTLTSLNKETRGFQINKKKNYNKNNAWTLDVMLDSRSIYVENFLIRPRENIVEVLNTVVEAQNLLRIAISFNLNVFHDTHFD